MKKLFLFFFFLLLFSSLGQVFAGYQPSFGGEYTNLCGSGLNANFYSCPADCDINGGWCRASSNEHLYTFVCDGRQAECRSKETYEGGNVRVSVLDRASVGSNKTVQIDVFKKKCRDSQGNWMCGNDDLLGYIVWYSGTSGGGGGGSRPQCNTNEVQLSISPNPSSYGDIITFKISAGDASTWGSNIFSDPNAVSNCQETRMGWEWKCRANKVGTFTWTRNWRHCEGSFDNCSDICSRSINFSIRAKLPIVVTLPAVVTL